MQKRIVSKGVSENNYLMVENWVDIDFVTPLNSESTKTLRKEFGIPDSTKIILYSGNLGEKQGLEIIVEAAEQLRAAADICFLVCGDGVMKRKLITLSQYHNLTNIIFKPLVDYNILPILLSLADIHLIPQKKAASDLVLPSKFSTILASGGVAIVATEPNTTLFHMIDEYKIGILVEPENNEQLVAAIQATLAMDCSSIRSSAREFAEKHLDKEVILNTFLNSIASKTKTA